MRLLITTQTLDRDDPYLGFFHDWVAAFASRFDTIDVICLREGKHELPANVRVHSLGKEHGRASRLSTVLNFRAHLRELSGAYDAVFVHMNPEYVMAAGWYWRRRHIPVALWYNHEEGGVMLTLAARLVQRVFHTSPYAASARFPNARRMPVGIDVELFAWSDAPRSRGSIYFQGRISPKKRVHLLIEAVAMLREKGEEPALAIVGPEDRTYADAMRSKFASLIARGVVRFLGPKPLRETPAQFAQNEVAVNLTAAGNFDKTGLEALACGTLLLASSPAYEPYIPAECRFKDSDAASLAAALHTVLGWDPSRRREAARKGRERIEREDSLPVLADRLKREMDELVG